MKKQLRTKTVVMRLWIMLNTLSFICIRSSAMPLQDADYIQNVKAVFIYNFTRYMNWNDPDSSSTFDIAVIGESRILDPLEQIALKRRVNQKEIRIRHFENAEQISSCHILFIPESEKEQLNGIVDKVRRRNILIVSEIESALSSGVMINFLISQETIKFEINLQAMKQSGFQPGSELLKLAVRLIE